MAQFRKWIKSENERYEFWFTGIFEWEHIRFFVTVVDASRELIFFNMKMNANEQWEITEKGKLPAWILHVEEILSDCIKANYSTEYKLKHKL